MSYFSVFGDNHAYSNFRFKFFVWELAKSSLRELILYVINVF